MEVGIEVLFAKRFQKNLGCFLRDNVTGFKRVRHEDRDQEKLVFFSFCLMPNYSSSSCTGMTKQLYTFC